MREHLQYRGVYRTPASILDSDEDRLRGYKIRVTEAFNTKEEAKNKALKNSEESHASFIGWDYRTVIVTDWEADTESQLS